MSVDPEVPAAPAAVEPPSLLLLLGKGLQIAGWEAQDMELEGHVRHVPLPLRVKLRRAAQAQRDAEQRGAPPSMMALDVRVKVDGYHLETREIFASPRALLAALKAVGS